MDNESTYICMELELFLWNKKLQTILFQDIKKIIGITNM